MAKGERERAPVLLSFEFGGSPGRVAKQSNQHLIYSISSNNLLGRMTGFVDITPPVRYSFAERSAARLSLSKSRFFLVLGLGAHFETEQNPLPATLVTCSKPNIVLKVVRLASQERLWSHNERARILIELKGRQSPRSRVATANRIVSAIGGLFAHVHHTAYHDLAPYQIPRELVKGTEVSEEKVEELEAHTGRNPYPAGIQVRLRSCVIIPEQLTATIFYLLPFVLQNETLFNACSFFRSCCSEFSFMDGVVREVLDEPKRGPENEIERLALENVVLQSFRIVEAIVGEPGKGAKRFREHLKAWGIDYNERVGFLGRRKHRLEDQIRWLQNARDSAAAHGRRSRPNPFTLFEAMEAQHLADEVLHRALWWTAESLGREGDESEVAFLLEAMFPNYPGWAKDKKLFRGERAVDLARTRGGLARIHKYQERRVRALLD
jgi:hypothetical protein